MNSYVEVTKISATSLLINKNKFIITHCSGGEHHPDRILADLKSENSKWDHCRAMGER